MSSVYYFLARFTRLAYRIRGIGLGRICELVRRMAARYGPPTPLIIDNFRGDCKFMCYLKEHMGSQIFFRGSYSGDQLTLLERLLNEYSVFVDAGANQGEFTVAAARVAPRGKIIAFEPVSEYRTRLIENVRLNKFSNVIVIPAALGEEEGSLPIYDQIEDFKDGTRNEGLPSLFASATRRHIRETVPVKRLDDVLKELNITCVDVIKMDIEGAEWLALRGAVNIITSCRPILIIEIGRETCRAAGYEPEAMVQWLIGLNYRIEKIIEGGNTLPIDPASLDHFQNVVAYPV